MSVLSSTQSVCPVCLKRITAERVAYGDKVYLEKTCPEHGFFKTLIWKGLPDYASWYSKKTPSAPEHPQTSPELGCPYDCGLCPSHRQHSCCVLLEVTSRCNLGCPVCFASADASEKNASDDPTIGELEERLRALMLAAGKVNIQLSGGEPTVRDDLPELITAARRIGFTFFQLNTNGIRIADEDGYIEKLAAAGLSCVFLQFDGVDDDVNIALRGRPLLETKLRAIARCRAASMGVVLVPVIAPGVNDRSVGAIIDFALENMPAVRGVHFQPISYFGRHIAIPEERYTLPDLLRDIEAQTNGRMKTTDFSPGGAENSYCSFSGNFMLESDGSLRALTRQSGCCCGCGTVVSAAEAADKARRFVARRWTGGRAVTRRVESAPRDSLDEFLERMETATLAISCMTFMDAYNLDLDRLKDCYIHVAAPDKRIIPFCAYNLTSSSGDTLYR